jgi:glutaredoxin 3
MTPTANNTEITIYSTATCASCDMVKRWLKIKGLDYQEVRVDQDPQRQQEAIDLTGQSTVPVTVISSPNKAKNVIVGFKPGQLAEAVS